MFLRILLGKVKARFVSAVVLFAVEIWLFIVRVQSRVLPEVMLNLDCTVYILEANNKYHNGVFCDKVQISDVDYWVRVQIKGALLFI